jgi:hypothetical protein
MLPSLRLILEPWRLVLEPWRLILEPWGLILEPWRTILSGGLDVNSPRRLGGLDNEKKTRPENLILGHYKRKRVSLGG